MNRSEIVDFCTKKTQLVQTDDVEFAQLATSRRYELIYNAYLWKDSLVMVQMPFDATTDADNAEGILVLPQMIDRVVAIRSQTQSVRVQELEYYYRIDYDAFSQGTTNVYGAAAEFSILSPIWFVWRGYAGLSVLYSDPNTDTLPILVTWRDVKGIQFRQQLNNGNLISSTPATIGDDDPRVIIVSGAGTADANGVYTGTGAIGAQYTQVANSNYFIVWTGAVWRISFDTQSPLGIKKLYRVPDTTGNPPVYSTGWIQEGGDSPVPTTAEGVNTRIEIASVYKPVTVGTVTLVPQVTGDDAGGSLATTDTASPSYQRVRIFQIPSAALTLNVLGKMPVSPLTYDQEVPQIRNIDNCLIAFVCGDLLQRARQYGKAQVMYQEGAALLKELANLETVQAANHTQFIPDNGMGDAYFGPGQSGYWGFGY